MANPRGESSWTAYLEEATRNATDLERRVNVLELHVRAVNAEPGSLRLRLSYCNFFQSLWDHSNSDDGTWPEDDKMAGQELFPWETVQDAWRKGYEAIQYRLSDSHEFWDRWISVERDQFSRENTPDLLSRITRLYSERLATPHLTWDETSASFSSFLTEYNPNEHETIMKQVTSSSQGAKRAIQARDTFELKLKQAQRKGDVETEKSLLREYLDWEMQGIQNTQKDTEFSIRLCSGLFDRALTGLFATDEETWQDYIVFLSSSFETASFLTRGIDACERAVEHCPTSGRLWGRYIQSAEEAQLPFDQVESIKNRAILDDQLCKDGMESTIEVYCAWCSYLRRTAVKETDRDAERTAEAGLKDSIASVMKMGKVLYGKTFLGDPKYRLEKIYIQFLTEVKAEPDEARQLWKKLGRNALYADSYDYWFNRYTWEMLMFVTICGDTPYMATEVLLTGVVRKSIDWPEKILEAYSQHCSLWESPDLVRQADDVVHQRRKEVTRQRQREEEARAAQYAAYYESQAQVQAQAQAETQVQAQVEHPEQPAAEVVSSPNSSKRKRELPADELQSNEQNASKRPKNSNEAIEDNGLAIEPPKRDRENSTILVTNLPYSATQTETRKYFRPYGHINNITAFHKDEEKQSTTALIEYRSAEEAESALLRDAKYFGESQISVQSGHDLTVYVANYPPAADEKYIRDLFQDCGQILSIRWPSLKVNTHRRFCYVSFLNREASAKAVAKEGKLLDGKFNLLAKYSNPNQKKHREGAVAEGREVHISNLDHSASEAEIRDVFGKFGQVQRVNIPQSMAGRNRGFAFLDFETKEQASRAVEELNNTKFRSQIIKVQVSTEMKVKPTAKSSDPQRPSPSPAPGSVHDEKDGDGDEPMQDAAPRPDNKPSVSDKAARTIAVMGLPDTVNDARVRALVEPLGQITKLIHQPGHGGAIIEFADVTAAGKAALQLNSMQYEGHTLRTGTPDELRLSRADNKDHPVEDKPRKQQQQQQQQQKEHAKKPKAGFMPPPRALHRPAAQGRSGPKKMLGFAPRMATSSLASVSSSVGGDDATKGGASGAQKSNADFKALFLAGKKTD
ncbi:hypothetical protein E4U09_003581 [Claviceps aff. purpurea]|uniref:U4/U6 snRNA-associated-splicing factor PRP24 n=1 Tax=Claviceps aff. purpurea TaxID=1967640 RepID=A0A9P7U0Y5_9HYPO|nr:hypothetical protein E4U09_003581 [Claviceps aff. purpurea]